MPERIVVIGCGLIGGSIVRGLHERAAAAFVAAIDRRDVLDLAAAWLDGGAEPDTHDADALVAGANLVVLAAPTGMIVSTMARVLDQLPPAGAATDCGSVKQPMVNFAAHHGRGDRFVAGHPMAGREIGGFAASSSSLFEGRRWYVVSADAATDAREQVLELVRSLGATPTEVNAANHDRAMAYVSHTPQLVASALVDVAAAAGCLDQAGPGFEYTTRIAGGPEGIWRDILAANGANVRRALDDLIGRLVAIRGELGNQDGGTLEGTLEVLARARRARGR